MATTPEAHYNLGNALRSECKLDAAIDRYRRALELKPDYPEAHFNLANALKDQGYLHAAVESYHRAIELRPELAEAHNNLGNTLTRLERLEEAAACYRSAADLQPQSAIVHNNLGNALLELSRWDEAVDCCRRALELNPDFAAAHNNLGIAWTGLGRLDEAVACCRRALELQPDYAEAHYNLANALGYGGELDDAAAGYRRALELKPDFAKAHNNLGSALKDQGKLEEAIACYHQALELAPGLAEFHNNLGTAFLSQGKLAEAVACFGKSLDLQPDFADAHNNLGNSFKDQGRLDQSLDYYRRAIELKPQDATAHSNLLLTLHYCPGVSPAALAEAHAAYDRMHASAFQHGFPSHERPPDRQRLRVGFVSHDLGRHPVGYFLVRVLENLNPDRLETICYTDRTVEDDMTNRLRAAATQWRSVVGLNDEGLADEIRKDQIDILFDLAGHTGHNRLLVFARKPAPIQITWAGYAGTTGLSAMDYLLADRYEVPVGAEHDYHEQVLRMPDGYVCYDPPAYAPSVSALPALGRGYVTFGCFNYPGKVTPRVVEVWSRILHRLPDARLLLAFKGWDDSATARRLRELFASHGIDPGRLELRGSLPHAELLAEYRRVDLALDPFPYSGGLTTCESLWMGVPVMTCRGETFASRHALTHLSNVGLTETIAQNFDEYVDLAVSLAGNLPRLAKLRSGLRERMAASPLCDGKRFAVHFESLLWDVWGRRRPDAAVAFHRRQAALHPGDMTAHFSLGNACFDREDIDEAIASYRRALALQPDCAAIHNNLGNALLLQGKVPDAIDSCRRAIELQPDFAEAHNNLGNALKEQGQLDEAVACYRRALDLQPNLAEAHNNLGAALFSQGQPGKAIECYERALKLRPDFAEAHNNLGNAWQSLAKLNNAVACHRRALELKPDYADACNNLGNALREQGWLADAAACCRRAAELKPDFAEAHNNLGNALKSQGRLDEAIECYRRALELKPEFRGAHSNLLYSLHYREGTTPAALARAHAAYERQHAAPLRGVWPRHANPRASERRLRVGFVSPNLGRHPVGYFLVRVLENLNRERLETVCYSDRVLTHDLTCRLKSAVTGWRDVAGLGDEQLANQIQADQIDILFDLAGHTGCNRLLVFARKPAPIQITWIGYEGTTGLEAMDYLLADRHVVPEGSERHYRERILRLPDGYLCYDPPADAPPVGPLPALTTGTVTFGSFNNLAKITEKVVETWARILRKVPTARLIMKYRGLGDEPVRRRYLDLFSAHGVEPHRVDLQPFSSYPDYLATCQQVDLALDPFPFSGGTITCESLWMGIPVVTRPGATFASRHSLSHLSNLRLSELIAKDRRDYVERAVSLAGDLPRLAELRSGLRERMAASPLCDGKQFAAHFESLLHDVWGRFVNESSGGTGCRDSLAAAIADHRAGNLSAAEARYRQILAEDQNNADAWCLLGVTAFHFNRRADAIRSISRAIELNGANVDYHDNLAAVYRSLGRLDEAARCYRRVLEINPAHGTARCRLQQILDHRRINELRTDEASDISEAALDAWIAQARDIGMLQIDSEIRSLCNFLRDKRLTHVLEIGGHHGGTFFLWCRLATGKKISLDLAGGQFGGLGEDDVSLRNDAMRNWAADVSALVGDSHDQKIREQISGILQGDQLDLLFIDGDHTYEGVKADYQMYSEFVRPGGYIVFHDIVDSHQHREQNCRVAQFWNEIAGEKIEFNAHGEWGGIGVVQRPLRPDQAEFYRYLGAVAQARGDLASAQANYRQALELNPDFTVAHNNLGNVYKELGQLDEAVACYLEAIEIQPDSPVAHNNLAVARTSQGKLHEAVASYRRGLELKPDLVQAHCNLLYTLNFCPDLDPAGVYEEHRRWNNLHATPLAKFIEPHANDRSPDRRLRVGYVSSDFSKHPVGLFLLPLLAHHDRRNFEIYCFSSVARPDEITESYRAQSHHWRDVCEMTDQQVAQMIREDQIDILVDLTMHMPGNRLLAFARKPAPVQITYLAYCGTTGLDAMDYRLTDPRLDPVGHNRGLYSEESIHLPETYWCYPDRGEIPAVAPAPAITAGHVTFGCLNNFCKVNEPTREVWIRLLKAMPESRLLLHAHPGSHRNELLTVFAGQDIAAERLEFIGYQPTADYLKAYNRVDIALDPFPLGGGTTTCDALWMGVPVVTLAGGTALGRGGFSILSNLGLTELVAHDRDGYVRIALDLARDKSRLDTLRSGLRQRMRDSPLMNAPRFAMNVEAAYRNMWQRWCAR